MVGLVSSGFKWVWSGLELVCFGLLLVESGLKEVVPWSVLPPGLSCLVCPGWSVLAYLPGLPGLS